MQPTFVLKIENEELGINAGLQDRVVQVSSLPTHAPLPLPIAVATGCTALCGRRNPPRGALCARLLAAGCNGF